MPAKIKSGGFCVVTIFACSGAAGGASALIQSSSPKLPVWLGLYLNPPQDALILSVDEKPSIQALERAQSYLRLPDGKAAITSATATNGMGRRLCLPLSTSRQEWSDSPLPARTTTGVSWISMNEICRRAPGREIHVVLANLTPICPTTTVG
jgi:hypothetical protein